VTQCNREQSLKFSPPSSAVSPQSIESLDMWVSRPRLAVP
jgi:hypothetical protein